MITKQEIINKLNETGDYKAMGFELLSDTGQDQLLVKPWGNGVMQINRCETEDGVFYDDDVEGWNL